MSKELTEKWKNGELFGHHYVKIPKEEPTIHNVSEMDYLLDDIGVEVLAPVPSFDEYKELTQKIGRLELDNEVLEDVVQECNKRGLENKKLQEQLKEANDCINSAQLSLRGYMLKIKEYKEKWGVK